MIEKKSQEELIQGIAAMMPDASEDEIAHACLAAGIWSEAEQREMAAKAIEVEIMNVWLDMEAEGLGSIRNGIFYPAKDAS